MFKSLYQKLQKKLYEWLTYEPPTDEIMPYDFNRLKSEIRPGDVLLIEGRSRISSIIRTITQSSWTHAALYIGRIHDFEEEETQELVRKYTDAKPNTHLIIEDLIDKGTVISLLSFYRHHHIRICRPIGISPTDLQQVINYTLGALGQPYNVRHLFDLARFLLPWSILPRRWGSSLFHQAGGQPESGVCTSLIAEAFLSVQFPILPYIQPDQEQGYELFHRNPYLFVPKDFDFSPYFEIIKYPLFSAHEPLPYYRRMPWTKSGRIHQDNGILSEPIIVKEKQIEKKAQEDAAEKKQQTDHPEDKKDE